MNDTFGNGISLENYSGGYYLVVFNLLSTDEEDILPMDRKGNLGLHINFSSGLPTTTTLILFASFPSVLTFDAQRTLSF